MLNRTLLVAFVVVAAATRSDAHEHMTGPAAGQRHAVGPADACGRVTELDYFNEKRPECDATFPEPAQIGEPFDLKATAARADGILPDLRAVVPVDLTPCRKDGKDLLNFSAGIANVGEGGFQIRPGKRTERRPLDSSWIERDELTDLREGVQWILNAKGEVAQKAVIGTFGWHAIHNHYHTDAMALYEVRRDSPTGPLVSRGRKISFCLDDSYQHGAPGVKASPRTFDQYCRYPQGVSAGWVDEYPFSVAGQYVDITGAKDGDYYLIATVNPDSNVREKSQGPHSAWTRFSLKRSGDGPPVLQVEGHSSCDNPGLCGELDPSIRGASYFVGGDPPKTLEARLQLLQYLGFCE